MNLRGNIWRMYTQGHDDDQGGAVPTGTVIYQNIYARIAPLQPTLALLEQGLETPTIYNGVFQYPYTGITGGFLVLPNDQFEIIWPPIDIHYGQRFLILGTQYQSYNDQRKYVNAHMRRLITANSNELQ